MTKRYLTEHNVDFEEHNINEQPQYVDYLKKNAASWPFPLSMLTANKHSVGSDQINFNQSPDKKSLSILPYPFNHSRAKPHLVSLILFANLRKRGSNYVTPQLN